MKSFYLIALFGVLLVSWKIKSSGRPNEDTSSTTTLHLNQRGLVVESAFDYYASPSPSAQSKCALINVVVNETATGADEQSWATNTAIPTRVRRFFSDNYNKVFVCGNGVGTSDSDPSSHRFLGCSEADFTGELANPAVTTSWNNLTADTTVTDSLNTRLFFALDQSIASVPSSIEGTDLLETCQTLTKKLFFVTDAFEMLIEIALEETSLQTAIQNRGYILDAISHWSTGSYVGTYIYS